MIKTRLTLDGSGKKVWGYYLDEKDQKAFYEHRSLLLAFKNRVERLEEQVGTFRRIMKEEDVFAYFEEQIMKMLPKDKSVRAWEFRQTLHVASSFWSASRQAWENLVNKGLIVDRGSGWYRRKNIDG